MTALGCAGVGYLSALRDAESAADRLLILLWAVTGAGSVTLLLALYGFVAVWHEHQPAVRAYARAQTVLAGVWIAVCVLLSFAIIKVQSLVGMQCITIVRLVKETWWRNVLRCEKYVGEALVLSSSDGTLKSRTGTGDYFSISCEDKDTVRLCVRMVEPQTYTRPHLLRCTGRVCLGAELAIRRRRTRRRAPHVPLRLPQSRLL